MKLKLQLKMKFSQLLNDFKEMKHYLIVSTLVLILGIVLGIWYTDLFETLLTAQLERMKELIKGLAEKENQQWSMFVLILLNNLRALSMVIILGVFFGIFPLFFLLSNGLLIGFLASQHMNGATWFYFLKGILPHGIIEIPALIIASAYGIRFGFLMGEGIISVINAERRAKFVLKFSSFSRILLPLSILLSLMVFVAAVIESTLTYAIMK